MFRRMRFGTLSLFAAMLLVVSGAGWWKFHRDLYVEEIEVLAALKKEADGVFFDRLPFRETIVTLSTQIDEEIPWDAPCIDPVNYIRVQGEVSESTRARALALPRLTLYSEEAPSSGLNMVPKGDDLCEALLGRALPRFPQPTLHAEALERSLPDGEALDGRHAAEIAEAIRLAWQRDRPVYPKRMVVEKTADEISGTRKELNVQIWEPDRLLTYVDMRSHPAILAVSDDVQRDQYSFDGAWRRTIRGNRSAAIETGDARRGYPSEDYPYLGIDFKVGSVVSDTVLATERLEVDRVAKIDDVRYRVDFAPFHAPETPGDVVSSLDASVLSWSAVLRSDLDWAPEELRVTEDVVFPAVPVRVGAPRTPERYERRAVQRFERRGEYVLLVERLSEDFQTSPIFTRERTLVTTEFDPDYDDAAFDPRTLDPEVWPGRRPLPVWRWYRVTFAISVATFAFLIGRGALGFFSRTRPSNASAQASLSEEKEDRAQNADAATRGS